VLPFSSLAVYQDFCIADLSAAATPGGYPCKPPKDVTADDFHYGGLATPGTALKPFKISLGSAVVTTFPGLNGLGISAARMVMVPGGVAPLHSHPGGTELIFVIEGSVVCGFSSDNPGLQILDFALFANDLPTEVVNKVTNLDELQIVKLKALFGGRG
jgi:hypothetical protein